MTDTTQLNICRIGNIALDDVINKNCHLFKPGTVGIFYSPSRCYLAKVKQDGTIEAIDRNTRQVISPDLSSVFEARIFTKDLELRWLHYESGTGPAVLISEEENQVQGWETQDRIDNLKPQENNYLLWGKGDGSGPAPGWSTVSEKRVGPIHVPLEGVGEHQHVILKTREYFGEVDENSNVAVVEERLCGLEVLR